MELVRKHCKGLLGGFGWFLSIKLEPKSDKISIQRNKQKSDEENDELSMHTTASEHRTMNEKQT